MTIFTPVFIEGDEECGLSHTSYQSFTDEHEAEKFAKSQHRLDRRTFVKDMEPETLTDAKLYFKRYDDFNSYIIAKSTL